MKFAFILDTSPLMQIKKSVISDLPTVAKRKGDEAATAIGMSFFEQSIYAIEEFIAVRKKMGPAWKQDKYILALTAANPESNAALELEVVLDENNNEEEPVDEDAGYYQIGKPKDLHGTKILSNLWHPFRHFSLQL